MRGLFASLFMAAMVAGIAAAQADTAADANWTDRLVLASEDGRLRIDDVLYGTDNSGDGLRKALVELFGN